jgi:RNA polymerase sigma factor (sigma-70 family)
MKDSEDFSFEEILGEPSVAEEGAHEKVSSVATEIAWLLGDRKRLPLLTPEQVCELVPRIAAGDSGARDTMVTRNMGLVISIAKRYRWSSLSLEDLIQEGVIGLVTAVERFNLEFGTRFSTYATLWIRQSITQAIYNTAHTIRIPVSLQMLANHFLSCQTELLEAGIVPTAAVMAEKLDISLAKVRKIESILRTNTRQVSLDEAVPGYRGEAVFGDFIADTKTPEPTVVLQAKQELKRIQSHIERMLRSIRDDHGSRDRAIFLGYYGFDNNFEQRTLEETGKRFGVTREWVRQVLARIWKESSGQEAKQEFEQMLEGIPILEELAQTQVSWSSMRDDVSALAFLDMFRATARDALNNEEFALCTFYYGFDVGYRLRTQEETAEHFGITTAAVQWFVTSLWKRLKPYAKHLTKAKVKHLIEELHLQKK